KTKDGKFLHLGAMTGGMLVVGDAVSAQVDTTQRAAISRAHSATHLLQKALRNTLGGHVEQAGSLVMPDTLRFDFTHFSQMSESEINAVENEVNDVIMRGLAMNTETMPIEEAKKKGAMALFGEKYGDTVRVVRAGDYSMELCGGTHLDNTAKVGLFKITSEGSVAAGVRRIEAVCGRAVLELINNKSRTITHLAEIMKTSEHELESKTLQAVAEIKTLKGELSAMQQSAATGDARAMLERAEEIAGSKVIAASLGDVDTAVLRSVCDQLKGMSDDVVAVLAGVSDDKITFAACCGKAAIARGVRAGDLVRTVSAATGGKGGGRPDSAMAGGNDVSKLHDALALVADFVKNK
ncbi:MAG: DHHA1 domain-containing protein, partial [Clostridia bacterium]